MGDDYRLMLDSTWSYDYTDALRVGRAIEEMGYYWFEDPLADEDIYNYVKLRQKLDIPIMATEFPAGGLDTYPIWLTEKATDYLRGDIPNKGGLTTMLKTAHLAEAFGLNYEVHHSGNSLNNLANLHLCMALRNTTMWEVLLPDGAHKYGMVKELEIDKDGLMHAPTEPGLGGEIDFELIRREDRGGAAIAGSASSPGAVPDETRTHVEGHVRRRTSSPSPPLPTAAATAPCRHPC